MAGSILKTLVICRYTRPLDWLDQVPSDWKVKVVWNGHDRLNEGREPGAFYWWIHNNYDTIEPKNIYAFVQDGIDHCTDLGERLKREITHYTPLGNTHLECDGLAQPHHPGLPVELCYEKWFRKAFPGTVEFTAGGQFAVTGKEILKQPKSFYKYMEREMSFGEQTWCMERLWSNLFA